jgi:hypothetical protein
MLNCDAVKNFCFDVLGDLVSPSSIEVSQARNGKFNVIVLRTGGVPKEVIRDDWNRQITGTEFEGQVVLYM